MSEASRLRRRFQNWFRNGPKAVDGISNAGRNFQRSLPMPASIFGQAKSGRRHRNPALENPNHAAGSEILFGRVSAACPIPEPTFGGSKFCFRRWSPFSETLNHVAETGGGFLGPNSPVFALLPSKNGSSGCYPCPLSNFSGGTEHT
jgi:hypothetical protein